MRDLAGRSDRTSRNSFKGSIKFIPITFLWNAQEAHALSMKIIFNLIDVLFGKNRFFEQLLINYLQFFISDSVITSCIFRKEPNFNLYSVLICLFLENVIWKKKSQRICNQLSDLQHQAHNEKCVHNGILLSFLSCKTKSLCTTLPVVSLSFVPLFVDCNFLFLGIWFALGQSKYEQQHLVWMGSCLPDK